MLLEPQALTVSVENGVLIVSDDDLSIGPHQSVLWIFEQLSPGHFGRIEFLDRSPFACLQVTGSTVLGLGNVGTTGTFEYRAQILTAEGAVSMSTIASVGREVESVDLSPVSVIDIDGVVIPEVPPLRVVLNGPAVWVLRGVPHGAFLTFLFEQGFAADQLLTGPFSTFSTLRGALGEHVLAIGSNFRPPIVDDVPQEVTFKIQLRSAGGLVIAERDPVIQPLVEPPPVV